MDPPSFERSRTVLLYGGAIKDAIQRFKYGPAPHLAKQLSQLLKKAANTTLSPDAVVPVPLHPTRMRARGFNQSALLASQISTALDTPYYPGLLRRIRDTRSQIGLSRAERIINLKGAFRVFRAKEISDRRVLLVDDVITTTATIREAASTLLRAGAHSVEAIALARASSSALLAPFGQKS
ncbi:MAG: ComF family protein [Proteobacteria bacterium]|nr:ComF family protein [Pseudomonadota bacterium]